MRQRLVEHGRRNSFVFVAHHVREPEMRQLVADNPVFKVVRLEQVTTNEEVARVGAALDAGVHRRPHRSFDHRQFGEWVGTELDFEHAEDALGSFEDLFGTSQRLEVIDRHRNGPFPALHGVRPCDEIKDRRTVYDVRENHAVVLRIDTAPAAGRHDHHLLRHRVTNRPGPTAVTERGEPRRGVRRTETELRGEVEPAPVLLAPTVVPHRKHELDLRRTSSRQVSLQPLRGRHVRHPLEYANGDRTTADRRVENIDPKIVRVGAQQERQRATWVGLCRQDNGSVHPKTVRIRMKNDVKVDTRHLSVFTLVLVHPNSSHVPHETVPIGVSAGPGDTAPAATMNLAGLSLSSYR